MFPPAFPPAHATEIAILGNAPQAAMIAAAYPGPGALVVYAMMYPIIETRAPAAMNGPRRFMLSDQMLTMYVEMPPRRKGGIDSS